MKVRLKRIDTNLPLPEYATKGSCGFDLYSRLDATIAPQEISLLPSNLIIETPADHLLLLAPRSSLAKKKGLIMPNSVGIIDQDYSGEGDEVLLQIQNVTNQPVTIKRGERIAQGIFLKIAKAEWEETTTINNDSRGGIGSTGGYYDIRGSSSNY